MHFEYIYSLNSSHSHPLPPPNFEIFFLSPFSPVSQWVWARGLPWLWLTSQESHLSAWQGLMPTSPSSCCDFVCLELAQVLCTLSQWLWVHKCNVLLCLENTFLGVTATLAVTVFPLSWLLLVVHLPISGMNCNPKWRKGTPEVQISRPEDNFLWFRSWGGKAHL